MWESCSKTHIFISALKPNQTSAKTVLDLCRSDETVRMHEPVFRETPAGTTSLIRFIFSEAEPGVLFHNSLPGKPLREMMRSHVSTGHSGNPGNNTKQAPRAQFTAVCCYTRQLWRWNHTLHSGCNTAKPYGTQTRTNRLLKTQTGAHVYVCMFGHSNALARITPGCS